MDTTNAKYLDDLIQWLSALHPQSPVSRDTLYVGRCIAEALHKIDSIYFHEGWLEKVQQYDETANWRVKANNLRKIFRRVNEFYKERLSKHLDDQWIIDPSLIADEQTGEEVLSRLLQLVLGAALLSKSNRVFVPDLLNQPQSVQITAMEVVQKLNSIPSIESESESIANDQSTINQQSSSESTKSCEEVAALHAECDRLTKELKENRNEMEHLIMENEALKSRVEELSTNSTELETLKKQLKITQISRDNTQDTLFKVEAERDHLKEQLEHVNDESCEMKTKIDGIIAIEEEYRKMKDELEEYRLRAHEFDKMSAQIETYKAKIRDHKSQEVEMKVLNEKIATYMQSVIALEDEQRKNTALKTQIEALRLANNDINNKLRAEIRRADKAEFEFKRTKERADEAEQQIEHLRAEYKQLKESHTKNEKLALTRSASSLHDETVEIAGAPATLQERLLKLEAENEHLRTISKDCEKMQMMKDEIESMSAQIAELETESRLANLENVQLQTKLKEADERLMSDKTDDGQRLAEQQERNEKLEVHLAQLDAKLQEANGKLAVLASENARLSDELMGKDRELSAEKKRLVRYMEKARRVIDDLEEQNRAVDSGALSRHEFDSIRRERDTYKQNLEALKETMERNQALQEQEQRLITTHAYHMMMQLHQQSNITASSAVAGGDHPAPPPPPPPSSSSLSSGPERSFLTRQRQCGTLNVQS